MILSGVLLYLAFRKVEILRLLEELGKVEWWFLALQAGMFVILMGLGAWRWAGLILGKVDLEDWKAFFRATYLGVFYGIFFPTAVAGDALKWASLQKKYSTLTKAKLFGSVLADRIVGLSTFILVAVVAVTTGAMAGLSFPDYMPWLFGGLMAGVIGFYWLATELPLEKWSGKNRIADKIIEIASVLRVVEKKRLLRCLGLSMICEIIWMGQIYLSSLYFGADFGLIRSFAYLPAIYLVLVLPISVAGFGAREQLYLLFFEGIASKEKILVVSTFMGLINVANALLGGLGLVIK